METIKGYTLRGQRYIQMYNNAKYEYLRQCHVRPSHEKLRAEWACKKMMYEEKGECFKIISYSHFFFSCAWLLPYGLRVETRSKSILVTFEKKKEREARRKSGFLFECTRARKSRTRAIQARNTA